MEAVAGIVLYNPDIEVLKNNISILEKMVTKIILYDNTEYKDRKNIESQLIKDSIIYISEGKNLGIAYALNKIMEKAKELNSKWCFSFDQDSKIPDNIYSEYSKYFNEKDVGILCSQFIDHRRKFMKVDKTEESVTEVKKCITSASCTRIDVWEKVGKYDDKLFIDLVDNDFSKRVFYSEYKIYRINSVILEQKFGDIEYKDTKIARFWIKLSEKLNNVNIAKMSYKKKVSPLRIYYTNRNVIYLNEKHKKYGGIGYESYNCKSYIEFFVFYNLFSVLRGKEKLKIFKAIINGRRDGIKLAKEFKKGNCNVKKDN